MRLVAARYGLNYQHLSRQFQRSDFDRFDIIVILDPKNREELMFLKPEGKHLNKIHLLRDFDPTGDQQSQVPDPVHGDEAGLEEVYWINDGSILGLLKELESGALRSLALKRCPADFCFYKRQIL